MPTRLIREGILTSERVDKVAGDPPVEVTYRRLLSVADDFGRFTAHPKLVRAAIYPLRLEAYTDDDIARHLKRCAEASLIRLYEVDGKQYFEVLDFRQRTRARKSKYPVPEGWTDGSGCCGWHEAGTRPTDAAQMQAESESDSESEARGGGERRRRENDYQTTFPEEDAALVKQAITQYMDESEPDDNLVVEVLKAGGGASARDICDHLNTVWLRGHRPGRAKGPRTFGWFIAVTRQHFDDVRAVLAEGRK